MKQFLTLFLLFTTILSHAQLNENFSDGDFTNNPAWTGSDFTIIDNKLRSNSSIANTNFYLSTPSTLANNAQWEFWVNLQFSTSGSNFIDIYVISDKADLKSSLVNGYFIRIGNTDDEISLYKRTGALGSSVEIIDGVNGSVGTTNNTVRVKLKRDNTGNFTLEREVVSAGSSFFTEGNITDLSHIASSHFGILVQQSTSSFFQKHFFDDFKIATIVTDVSPPTVISASTLDSNTVEIVFNEPMDSTSAKVASNYLLSNDGGAVFKVLTTNDPAKFNLRLANALKSGSYVVSVTNIKDRNGILIGANNKGSFSYIKPFIAQFGDLVINEIFADPSPQIDLPSVEFTELRNNTNQSISLKNWKFMDSGSSAAFGEIKIDPQSFLIICAKADTNEYKSFGKVLGLSPWPSLNNTGEILKLLSPENLVIDSVKFSDAWYRNSTKKLGGWTLERKDPMSKCSEFFNWFAAVDSSGGTPGRENSVYVAGYDFMPLTPDSLKQLSDTSITIYFNKHLNSSTLLSENFVTNPGTSFIKKIVADSEFKKVVVTYDKKFESGKDYQLKLYNLKDCSGILITDHPEKLRFRTNAPPTVIEIIDTAKLIITEIFADPSPEVNLPLSEFVEIYNPSNDAVDLDKWTFNDPLTKTVFRGQKILPREYIILCPIADTIHYKSYGRTIGLTPWPSLNNSSDQITLKSFKNRIVDSISYSDTWYKNSSKKLGGWSLEKIDLKSVCENYFNWTASIDTNGGTPGKQNSVHTIGYDRISLKTDSIKLTSDTTLKVYFNKHLNNATLIAENFKLIPENSVKRITADLESREVSLTYDKKFQPGTDYQMTVAGIKDCGGKSISNTGLLTFKTKKAPQPVVERADTARLVITEIFADPSPEIHLPLAEFVEIYNPSTDTVDLDKWTLSDPLTKTVFRGQKILPREYIILCPIADTVHYKTYGRTIGLNPWPSLNNSSDQITLKSFKNRIVDSISYFDAWYKNSSKKLGGWSLEKIDLKSVCENYFNWTASIDTNGGTPGKQNSVHLTGYDRISLKTDSIKLTSDTTLRIYFNKHLNNATLIAENFKLIPENSVKRITADLESREVSLTYDKKFQPGTDYQMTVAGIKDCSGKSISNTGLLTFETKKAPLPVVERPDTARLVITEIFADPSPEIHLPLVEFVEIYNPSTDTVDLDKWTLNDPLTKTVFRGQKILPREYIILCPIADTVHYKSYGRTIGLNPWPSLNNSSDLITLKSFKNRIVDSISYSDAWYKNSSKKLGGWSLEKTDLKSVCENYFNWTASIDTNGGTPGKQNSVHTIGYDSMILKADSLTLSSDTTITLHLNKYLNVTTLVAENFKLLPAGNSIKRITSDNSAKVVILTYDRRFSAGTEYQMSISNLKDCSGNFISSNYTLKFKTSYPPPLIAERTDTAKILITEIFADPSPEIHLPLIEFIEIYNPSNDTVDLDKWTLNDPTTQAIIRRQKIFPKEYIILCPIADTIHYKTYGKTIGLSPWPTLNNAADQVVLKSFKNRLIDSLAYSDTWYPNNSKKAGGWSLEKIDLNSKCEDFFNWTASIDTNGGTPGKQNSVNVIGNDLLVFKADSLNLTSDTTVSLYFNKPFKGPTITKEAFDLLPYNLIKKISSDARSREIVLTFGTKIQAGTQYTLSVSKLKDCSGKLIIGDLTLKFKTNPPPPPIPERVDTAKIFITEIFADPSPEVGLPLAEFVELYNPGAEPVDLDRWILGDPSTKGIITNVTLAPGAYMILCPVADTLAFKQFGKTKGISPWPLLGNNGDQLALKSFKQRLVDSVMYTDQWYKSRAKKSGGWSLEKADLNSSCNGFYNWFSSINELGGTPGRVNSVSSPRWKSSLIEIDSIKPSSDSTVVLHLSAIPDTNYLKHSQFTIDQAIGKATGIVVEETYLKIHLKFGSKFLEGVDYLLTADSLFNCSGKKAIPINSRVTFTIPIIPEIDYPIVINEILPDPSPQIGLPEIEFVELYNTSDKTVSLKGLTYGDETFQHKFNSGEIAPKSYLILCPQKDTVDFSPFGKVIGLPVWPPLANDKDVLILKNNKGRELQKVAYNTTWYKDSGKKAGGYSLEMISAVSICKDFQNWAASKDLKGGTPGRENSIHKNGPDEGLKLLESVLVDSVTLLLTFNKAVDSLSASIPGNYQCNNGVGKPDSVILILPVFEKVMLKFRQPIKRGHTYRVEVSNLRDCSGSSVLAAFSSTEFILTERIVKNSILINEILFNPNPGGVDFVEIYNNTKHTLDLQELSIATVVKDTVSNVKRINSKQLLFEPGHYILVTSDTEVIKKEYKIENPNKLQKAPLPPMGDDKGTVVLVSNGGRVDQFDYNEKMHFQLLRRVEGVSLERSSFELNSNAAGNFRSATAAAGFATPGYKNSQFNPIPLGTAEFALTSRTFSPDNDGFEDLLQVSYHLPAPGMVANIKIFNDKGVLVKNLLKNSTLNLTGIIVWDGLDEFGSLVGIGIYFIHAEIFDTNGYLKKFRRSFVLATKL